MGLPPGQRLPILNELYNENAPVYRQKQLQRREDEGNGLRINHVKRNIQLSAKINKIRDIQLFYRNYVRAEETDEIKKFKFEQDIVQRQISVHQLERWEDFKMRRQIVLDQFVKVRRKILMVKTIIYHVAQQQMVHLYSERYQKQLARRRSQRMQIFCYLKVAAWIRRRSKR